MLTKKPVFTPFWQPTVAHFYPGTGDSAIDVGSCGLPQIPGMPAAGSSLRRHTWGSTKCLLPDEGLGDDRALDTQSRAHIEVWRLPVPKGSPHAFRAIIGAFPVGVLEELAQTSKLAVVQAVQVPAE